MALVTKLDKEGIMKLSRELKLSFFIPIIDKVVKSSIKLNETFKKHKLHDSIDTSKEIYRKTTKLSSAKKGKSSTPK